MRLGEHGNWGARLAGHGTPHPFCGNDGKSTANDGNNASSCSDKGAVFAHPENTQWRYPSPRSTYDGLHNQTCGNSHKWQDSHGHPQNTIPSPKTQKQT